MSAQPARAPAPAPRPSRPRPVLKADGKARIPEVAIRRGGEVSPAAFRLYCYYSARRNNESGGWRVKNREAAEALGLSRSRVSEARKELRGADWIDDLGGDFIRPLVGFEAVEHSTKSVEHSTARVECSNESVENSTPYIDKDRARGSTSYTLPATATPTPRAEARDPESADADVRVSSSTSAFNFEERKAHAQANGLGPGWLQRSRSGEYDELIADARAATQPAAVEQSLHAPSRPSMSYRSGLLHLGSILDVNPQLDIAGAVAQLDVSEEDRARLLAYDFAKYRAAGSRGGTTGSTAPTAVMGEMPGSAPGRTHLREVAR